MRRLIAVLALSSAAPLAWADDFRIDCTPAAGMSCAQAFREVAKDVSAVVNYKVLGPAEPAGVLGFSVAAIGSYAPVKNEDAWRTLIGRDISEIGMAGGVVTAGLPFGFDVGFFYTGIPSTGGAAAYGAQLRYAVFEGGVTMPALAIGAHYTSTNNIDDFDYSAWGVDAMLSKGFAFLTPYVGGGYVSSHTKAADGIKQSYDLRDETVDAGRFFAGVRIAMFFFDLTPEYERFGSNDVYNLRLGLSF